MSGCGCLYSLSWMPETGQIQSKCLVKKNRKSLWYETFPLQSPVAEVTYYVGDPLQLVIANVSQNQLLTIRKNHRVGPNLKPLIRSQTFPTFGWFYRKALVAVRFVFFLVLVRHRRNEPWGCLYAPFKTPRCTFLEAAWGEHFGGLWTWCYPRHPNTSWEGVLGMFWGF